MDKKVLFGKRMFLCENLQKVSLLCALGVVYCKAVSDCFERT